MLKDGCRPGVKPNDFNSHPGALEGASNIPSFLHLLPGNVSSGRSRRLVAEVGIAAGRSLQRCKQQRPLPAASPAIIQAAPRGQCHPRGKLLPLKTTGHWSPGRGPTLTCQRLPGASNKGQRLTIGVLSSSRSSKDAPGRDEFNSWSWDKRKNEKWINNI